MSNYKDKSNEYYAMAMYDLAHDVPMEDIQLLFVEYEQREMYEACAGLKRAMETYRFIKDYYTIKDINDKSSLIEINYNKDE